VCTIKSNDAKGTSLKGIIKILNSEQVKPPRSPSCAPRSKTAARGFFEMLADPRLKPLHGRPEFEQMRGILAKMEAEAEKNGGVGGRFA
jgi:hypothetical protein